MLKINFKSYIFLLMYIIFFYFLLYVSIDFLIHGYIFLLHVIKHINKTYTLIILN
jgi:hypothetical protein